MRLIAAIMTLVALAAAGFAGQKLHMVLTAPVPQPPAVEAANAALENPADARGSAQSFRWPSVFGELQAPVPVAAPAEVENAEPTEPPVQAGPPIEALGYALKGVVRAGRSVWGMVSHPSGDQIVRVGDTLAAGVVVRKIDEAGLWIDNGSDELILLGFAPDS